MRCFPSFGWHSLRVSGQCTGVGGSTVVVFAEPRHHRRTLFKCSAADTRPRSTCARRRAQIPARVSRRCCCAIKGKITNRLHDARSLMTQNARQCRLAVLARQCVRVRMTHASRNNFYSNFPLAWRLNFNLLHLKLFIWSPSDSHLAFYHFAFLANHFCKSSPDTKSPKMLPTN